MVDTLSKMIHKENVQGNIKVLRIKQESLELTHLLLADDSILFVSIIDENVIRIKEVLDLYAKDSGQL